MIVFYLLLALIAIMAMPHASRRWVVAMVAMLVVISLRLVAGRPSVTRLPKRHPDHAYLTPEQLRALEVELGYTEPSEPLSGAPARAAALHKAMTRGKPGEAVVRSVPARSSTPPKPPPPTRHHEPKRGTAAWRAEYDRGQEEARDRLREIGLEAQLKAAKRRLDSDAPQPELQHLQDLRLVILANATEITNMARGREMTEEESEQWILLSQQMDGLDERIKAAKHREEATKHHPIWDFERVAEAGWRAEQAMGRDPHD